MKNWRIAADMPDRIGIHVEIAGGEQSYRWRESIKKRGGKWDPDRKVWVIKKRVYPWERDRMVESIRNQKLDVTVIS